MVPDLAAPITRKSGSLPCSPPDMAPPPEPIGAGGAEYYDAAITHAAARRIAGRSAPLGPASESTAGGGPGGVRQVDVRQTYV